MSWEDGTRTNPIRKETAQRVARLYNTMISSIIEGSSAWTLDNGYRNILATMGITLDGMFRNRIGDVAEALVKSRIVSWLEDRQILSTTKATNDRYELPSYAQKLVTAFFRRRFELA